MSSGPERDLSSACPLADLVQSHESLTGSGMKRLQGEQSQHLGVMAPFLVVHAQHPLYFGHLAVLRQFCPLAGATLLKLDPLVKTLCPTGSALA
jgi:hypothetical protein